MSDIVFRITNSAKEDIALHLEPWGEQYVMSTGSACTVKANGPDRHAGTRIRRGKVNCVRLVWFSRNNLQDRVNASSEVFSVTFATGPDALLLRFDSHELSRTIVVCLLAVNASYLDRTLRQNIIHRSKRELPAADMAINREIPFARNPIQHRHLQSQVFHV